MFQVREAKNDNNVKTEQQNQQLLCTTREIQYSSQTCTGSHALLSQTLSIYSHAVPKISINL